MCKLEEQLKAPFPYEDIEWRISRAYAAKGKATVLAYLTSRAVMDRLDAVFGIGGWKDEYQFIGTNIVCTLTCNHTDMGTTSKTDGAPQTNFEAFKGGISDALKRAAVKYGIGRYLYNLTESWVELLDKKPTDVDQGRVHYLFDKDLKKSLYWVSPGLPEWAIPADPRKAILAEIKEIGIKLQWSDHEKREFLSKASKKSIKEMNASELESIKKLMVAQLLKDE